MLTLRYWVAQHSKWVLLGALPVSLAIEFGFFVITPRLLLDLPFAWRDLDPGAAVCAGVSVLVHAFCRPPEGVGGRQIGGPFHPKPSGLRKGTTKFDSAELTRLRQARGMT